MGLGPGWGCCRDWGGVDFEGTGERVVLKEVGREDMLRYLELCGFKC